MKVTNFFLNFDFAGRARRSHYWANLGCWLLVALCIGILGAVGASTAASTDSAFGSVVGLLMVAAIIGAAVDNLAMVFRRAHDTGKSGWVWLLLLIPVVNLLPFYWLMIEDSQPGPNKYGPPVKRFYEPGAA